MAEKEPGDPAPVEVTELVVDTAGEAKDAVIATLGQKGGPGPGGDADHDRNGGLGWLWWALGAVVLVLALAWLLSTCSEAGPANGLDAADEAGEVDEADEVGEVDEADEVDEVEPAGAVAIGPPPTKVEPVDEPVDGGASERGGELSADDQLEILLAAVLAGSGVSATVADGVVTLTGTTDETSAKEGLVQAIEAIEGVGSVEDRIELTPPPPPAQEPETSAVEVAISIDELLERDPVRFGQRSATIGLQSLTVLNQIARLLDRYLADNPDAVVEIGGHTDSDGARADNRVLSLRRAEAVQGYLVRRGIDGARLRAVGYGEENPRVPNDSQQAKATNRRIELTVRP